MDVVCAICTDSDGIKGPNIWGTSSRHLYHARKRHVPKSLMLAALERAQSGVQLLMCNHTKHDTIQAVAAY